MAAAWLVRRRPAGSMRLRGVASARLDGRVSGGGWPPACHHSRVLAARHAGRRERRARLAACWHAARTARVLLVALSTGRGRLARGASRGRARLCRVARRRARRSALQSRAATPGAGHASGRRQGALAAAPGHGAPGRSCRGNTSGADWRGGVAAMAWLWRALFAAPGLHRRPGAGHPAGTGAPGAAYPLLRTAAACRPAEPGTPGASSMSRMIGLPGLSRCELAGVSRWVGGHCLARWMATGTMACLGLGYLWLANRLLLQRLLHHLEVSTSPLLPSDLFVPWLGARALVSGVDPYTDAFAVQLHLAFYGMVRQPTPDMPNVAAFGYPPYVVVALAPLLWLPFEVVRWLAIVALAICVAGAAILWRRLVQPGDPPSKPAIAGVTALLFFPSLDLLWLQQLTGLVIICLAGAVWLAARRHLCWSGVLLALA